jgi:hypothetical protein
LNENLVGEHVLCLSPYVENVSHFPNPEININESARFEKESTFNKSCSRTMR